MQQLYIVMLFIPDYYTKRV